MSDKPTRSGGGSGLATLPEWPEEPYRGAGFGELYQYWKEQSDAALARMEALVEVVRRLKGFAVYSESIPVPEIDALLAACERSVAAQPSGAGRRKS